jgi:hypothetical protein
MPQPKPASIAKVEYRARIEALRPVRHENGATDERLAKVGL